MRKYTEEDARKLARYGVTVEEVKAVTTHGKVTATCPYCGNDHWEVEAKKLLLDELRGCPECANKRISKSHAKTYTEEEYEYLAQFGLTKKDLEGVNVTDRKEVICPYCGNHYSSTISNLLHSRGSGCPNCAHQRAWEKRKESI